MCNKSILINILPAAAYVWVVSFETGVRLMMDESGEVSMKRDRDRVSANTENY